MHQITRTREFGSTYVIFFDMSLLRIFFKTLFLFLSLLLLIRSWNLHERERWPVDISRDVCTHTEGKTRRFEYWTRPRILFSTRSSSCVPRPMELQMTVCDARTIIIGRGDKKRQNIGSVYVEKQTVSYFLLL